MGMRLLFPASWYVLSGSSRAPMRRRARAAVVDRAARVTVESLETRVLFAGITATLTPAPPPTVTTPAPNTENIVVTYVDTDTTATLSGFAAGNLSVTPPAGVGAVTVTQAPGVPVQAAGTATVTYVAHAPGAVNWNASENGSYTITLNAGVTDADVTPHTVTPGAFGTPFAVAIAPTATVAPVGTITSASPGTASIVVTYRSNGGLINASTLATNNITVNGPTGVGSTSLNISAITPAVNVNAAMEVVTYTVNAPGGGLWSIPNDGTYTIGIAGNVTDTAGVPVAANASAGTFTVSLFDSPTGVLTQPAPITTRGGRTIPIVVTFSDPGAANLVPVLIDGTTIDTSNITVTGPTATPVTIIAVSPVLPANGSPIVVTYTASLPAGFIWEGSQNGTYTISLENTVQNTDATPSTPATLGTFIVNVPDSGPPTATLTAPPLLQSTGITTTLVVNYIDDTAILTSSVVAAGTAAITVKDTATGETLTVDRATLDPTAATDPATLAVTYTVSSPSLSSFSAADNGSYTVAITGAPAVTDTLGKPIAAIPNLGTFVIDIGDTSRPTGADANGITRTTLDTGFPIDPTTGVATLTTNAVTGAKITFVLSDNAAIKASTIKPSSLKVLTPDGAQLTVTSLSVSSNTDARTITAIYVVAPPNGNTFLGADNGTYTVTLNGVTDVQGLAVLPSSVNTTFAVNIDSIQNRQFHGQFGVFNGKPHTLRFFDVPLGATVTISARGGQGGVIQESDGSLSLIMDDFGGGLNVTVKTTNGHPVNLASVIVHGSINNFQALSGNLEGTFQVSGMIARATFRQIVGELGADGVHGILAVVGDAVTPAVAAAVGTSGTLVATGAIQNVKVLRSVTDAQILSGVNFGADGIFGTNPNTLIDDDTYTIGSVHILNVGGAFTASVIAAGASPGVDLVFGLNPVSQTDDDQRAGAATSVIDGVTAVGSDGLTRFEAGHYGVFKFRKHKFMPDPVTDNRFKGL